MPNESIKTSKVIAICALTAALVYSASMIVIRLKIMQTAYEFEEAKTEERSLREEQQRLRAQLSEALTPDRLRLRGFQEPELSQIVRIPKGSK